MSNHVMSAVKPVSLMALLLAATESACSGGGGGMTSSVSTSAPSTTTTTTTTTNTTTTTTPNVGSDTGIAGTVGMPGRRTFFLQATAGARVTSVALEKTQVAALAERMDELLRQYALLLEQGLNFTQKPLARFRQVEP